MPSFAEPLRVAVVSRSVYPLHGYGGLERHVHDLVRHLVRRDVRVTLITRPPIGAGRNDAAAGTIAAARAIVDDERLLVEVVPYRTFPFAGRRGTTVIDRSTAYPAFGWRAGRAAARLVACRAIDVVHGLGAAVLGYALAPGAIRSRAPLVLNPQGLEEFGGTGQRFAGGRLKQIAYRPLQWAVRRCARAAAAVVATDHAIEPSVRRYLPVSPDRVVVIPNAIDIELCDAAATSEDGAACRARASGTQGAPILLSVGRLERNKGFHVLAEALARLTHRAWRWVLAGEGPFRQAIEARLAALGLSGRTTLLGRVDTRTLHAWYEAADIFVHPTLYEGSSLVTLEAMAHRRAVVATTAGGLPDKVRPGETGWLAPPGDASALADALDEALARPERLPALGRSGRELAEREFSWPVVADRTVALYARLRRPVAG